MPVSYLDLILIFVIGVSVITGFLSGFARVSIGLVAALAGILCGLWFYGEPAAWVMKHLSTSKTIASMFGFLAIFFGFLVAGALLGKLVAKMFKWVGLSWADRLMGGVFGLARGAVLAVALITVVMAFTPNPPPEAFTKSKVLPYAVEVSGYLAAMAPRELKDAYQESLREIRKVWEERLKPKKKLKEEEA
jgi:membrane protein required for colicin V production